ncbi:MAG: nitric oxide reductase activation protein NorD [Pseudomonadota bacterium]
MSSSRPSSELPLQFAELEDWLDELLNPVLSSRRTASGLARALAPLTRRDQDFALHWVDVIGKSNHKLAYQFASLAPRALELLGERWAEDWLIQAVDVFDEQGLYPASARLKDLPAFAERLRRNASGVDLDRVRGVLELFLCGLAGRTLKVDVAEVAYTDTETVYLPETTCQLPTREQNFAVFKATAGYLWAQSRFGTFSLPLADYPTGERALRTLNFLESIRLGACIERHLPGLARTMVSLQQGLPAPRPPGAEALMRPDATIRDSLELLGQVDPGQRLPDWCYLGALFPERAAAAREERIAREQEALGRALRRVAKEARQGNPDAPADTPAHFDLRTTENPEEGRKAAFKLLLDGTPLVPPPDVEGLVQSLLQDLGDVPPEYLVPAGDGPYTAGSPSSGGNTPRADAGATDAVTYDEWDYRRQHYRRSWCALHERDVHPGDAGFVDATLAKFSPQVYQLKRTFEAQREENRRVRREPFGDEVDFDALVESYADLRQGMELPERLFVRHRRDDRNLAALFMVDMSGSTKGWINDAEREALVMLCEALEVLGDRYAIYGFSGTTRKRCEVFRVKRFDEPYDEMVKRRIAGIIPLDYTRMGPALRHAARLLGGVGARTKLLVTLSDGKPDDYSDEYRGEYGIQDTRQALLEAKRLGIHPFCITIDREAKEYLPRMYGDVNYTLVDDVSKLPLKVADIYRRLTT